MLKKGSLSISTNAIVVLIIAVVMLALILTLVTTGFSMIEDRFLAEIQNEPDPPSPSSNDRITINKDNIRAGAGDRIGFKFAAINIGESTITQTGPEVECSPETPFMPDSEVLEPIDLEPGRAEIYQYAVRLTRAPTSDVYLCSVRIDGIENHRARFRIDIR